MTNQERASRAKNALLNSGITPDTPETDIIDLITDLLHLAWEERLDPEAILRMAEGRFDEESEE